jgi:hypothetical protein
MERTNPAPSPPRRGAPPALAAALASLLAGASGCGGFYVEAEQAKACITENAIQIPVTVQGTSGSFATELSYDVGKWFPDLTSASASNDRVVRFLELQVQVPAGQPDVNLDWVGTFDVTLLPAAGSGLQEIVALHYQKPSGGQQITRLALESDISSQNLAAYLASGEIHFRLAGSGQGNLPGGTWIVNVGGCFYAKVRKGLGNL